MTATAAPPAPSPPAQAPGQQPGQQPGGQRKRQRSPWVIAGIAAAAWLLVVLLFVGALLAVGGYALVSEARKESSCSIAGTATTVDGTKLDAEQLANAQLIVTTAALGGYTQQAATIAVATAMTESSLRNVAHGDSAGPDSAGLFQQRASYGATRTDPTSATQMFLARLVKVRGWQTMTLTQAAAAVQKPAASLAGAYTADEALATQMVSRYWPAGSATASPSTTSTTSTSTTSTSMASGSASSSTAPTSPAPAGGTATDGASTAATAPATSTPSTPTSDEAQALSVLTGTSCLGEDGEGKADSGGTVHLPDGWHAVGTAEANVAIAYALAQVGKPYVWGGVGPAGFDCSGLMMKAWAAAGIAIPRTTIGQRTTGIAVASTDDLQPGDLIFIAGSEGTADNPRHVGMYIGEVNGVPSIVQAPKTGDVVQVDPLTRWNNLIVAIRRTGTT